MVQLAAARLRRVAVFLAAVSCAVLASAAAAASVRGVISHDGPAVPAPAVRMVIQGGMAGWQITLIALGAAAAAAAAVLLDRTRAVRQDASAA